jgi:hypothetical protein
MVNRRVAFKLTPDADGWPPAVEETLWAEEIEDGVYSINNIPFYVRDVSPGDIIVATPDLKGVLRYELTLRWSKMSVIRVLGASVERFPDLLQALKSAGCSYEGISNGTLYAVSVPPEAGYDAVVAMLEAAGADYEEASRRHT